MKNIFATIHHYYLDVTYPAQAAEYAAILENQKAQGVKVFDTNAMSGNTTFHEFCAKIVLVNGMSVPLETDIVFHNQWNSAPIAGVSENGLRLMDWQEWIYPNKSIKVGYYLEITKEMRELRDNTFVCGYCGKQEPSAKGLVFCPHCLGSEYLKSSDLGLLRLLPVSSNGKRAELTEAEKEHLLPLYRTAQIHGNTARDKARIAKQRKDIADKCRKASEAVKTEHDGLLWLLDHGVSVDNVIFYPHTGRFSFGWRSPVDSVLYHDLMEAIKDFPFQYDVKTA